MSLEDLRCPACGEEERLRGARAGELISLTCEACGHRWDRDPRKTCPSCGGSDLVEAPKAVVQKVRGDQMSVVGFTKVDLCRICDVGSIEQLARTRAPLPPDELPVKSRHAWQPDEP